MNLKIRQGRSGDLERCYQLESRTFPEEEAASRENIRVRLERYSEGFIVGEIDGRIVAHINSGSTNKDDITDEAFKGLTGHEDNGRNIVIFSVAVDPEYQRLGIASRMMERFVARAEKAGKERVLLLCKEGLIGMYEGMGYSMGGVSTSTHGGARWYEMEMKL